jgi:hypothetical protein
MGILLVKVQALHITYQVGWYSGKAQDTHSGDAWLKSWTGHATILTEVFCGFP